MAENNHCSIFNITIHKIDTKNLLEYIIFHIEQKKKSNITYINTNTLNLIYKFPNLSYIFNNFELLHPDGIGLKKLYRMQLKEIVL
ncbi:MAG: hypothetical protein P8Z35_03385 [Ignavibacteriaceae bacterium]